MAWIRQVQEAYAAAIKKSKGYTDSEIAKMRTKFSVVPSYQDLPDPGRTDTIYLVPKTPLSSHIYDQYIYEDDQYVDIGDTTLDLDGYVTDADLQTELLNYVTSSTLTTTLLSYVTNVDLNTRLAPIEEVTQNFVVDDGKLCYVEPESSNESEGEGEEITQPLATDETLQQIATILDQIKDSLPSILEQSATDWMEEHFASHPTTDGTYVLTCTVTNGEATYTWESTQS